MKQLSLLGEEFMNVENSHYIYYPNFLDNRESNILFTKLLDLQWKNNEIVTKKYRVNVPRFECLYGDVGCDYQYSGIKMNAEKWDSALLEVKKKVETKVKKEFNMVFCNLYKDGNHHIGWHSDDYHKMGLNPVIASVSLGSARIFKFMNKKNKKVDSIWIEHGSLLVMKHKCQQTHFHSLPKTKQITGQRINLTFRPFVF